MYARYKGLVSDEISGKIKNCESIDDWLNEAEDEAQFGEKIKICVANIIDVYGERYIMEVCNVASVLYKLRMSDLMRMCQDMKIIIPHKMMKRDRSERAIAGFILSQYPKTKVSNRLKSFVMSLTLDMFPMLVNKELSQQERYDAYVEQMRNMCRPTQDEEALEFRKQIFAFSACSMAWNVDDEEFCRFIQAKFDNEYWETYEANVWSAYCAVFCSRTNSHKSMMDNLLTEKKQLTNMYNSQVKQQKQLNQKLQQTTLEKDNLKGAITELNKTAELQLEDAIVEIRRLENLVEQIQEEKAEEIGTLNNIIINLQDQLAGKSNKPLKGLTVCVVGIPNDEQFFEQTITKYGGKFEFFPSVLDSTNPRLMAGPINRSDIVLYCHSYTSHSVRDILKSLAADKTEYLESNGKSSFEHLLLTRVIPKLQLITLTK